MLSLYEILKASKTGIAPDMWTAIAGKNWGGADSGHEVKELTGIPPLSFTADGTPLLDYLISGNMSQIGTPTPDSPIQPSECGELVNSQWTLPISSAGQTNNIYLGEVETTRYVKQLVLTGEENWIYDSNGSRCYINIADAYAKGDRRTQCYCSHYICVYNGEPFNTIPNHSIYINLYNKVARLYIKNEEFTSAADFKSFLAQQYANGTPVTIWYILATPETVTINEPIRKIGNYADTVSMEQAGVSISTLNGQTVVDVDTTLKPSEMYIKYQK